MIKFILNRQTVETDMAKGVTVLDFVRYHKNLKGTKIGCREGDCGACVLMVGELSGGKVKYRTQTSCLMPLANAHGKHVVTVEGINQPNDELTAVQQALVDESGTQCGFCTVGFVMSLTNFCVDETAKTRESAISAIDGNICRCTGYKSIERAACAVSGLLGGNLTCRNSVENAVAQKIVPEYFADIQNRLENLKSDLPNSSLKIGNPKFVGGGTDLYVQRPEEMTVSEAENLFDHADLRFIAESDEFVEIGASTVVTDLLESETINRLFPDIYKHLKLVSSTPVRNMGTLAGNFVNASPIGDLTAWFLALDAEIVFNDSRAVALKNFYLGYKQIAKTAGEYISKIRFRKNFTHFNFEKVCKRKYLDIASVNTAISLQVENDSIITAHVSFGGVAPIPLYLHKTSEFLRGKKIGETTISQANAILQTEISPIFDVRGSEIYKRLLARQLFTTHFAELFGVDPQT